MRPIVVLLSLSAAAPAARAAPADPPFPKAAANAVDPAALDALVKAAAQARSDALVVVRDGKLVGEWWFGNTPRPIEAMSATKSVVSLAVGALIDEGKIPSIDAPVHTFFPEWKQGKKSQVTIRHLLSHTSCLQNEPNTSVEIYPSPDFVKLALAAELVCDPGTRWAYNNKAANLLAGVVRVASGKRLDEYLRRGLFASLGITDFRWSLDRAGNPHGMSGLQIRPIDLARIGQLVLDRGRWHGKQLVSERWIADSTAPAQAMVPESGLLWWIVPRWLKVAVDEKVLAAAGVPADARSRVVAAAGREIPLRDARAELAKLREPLAPWVDAIRSAGDPVRIEPGPVAAIAARGYLGQYLVVVPAQRLVAVRMYGGADGDEGEVSFPAFEDLVMRLVPGVP